MAAITLVSESQAKEGNRFYYVGSQTECGDCRLKGVCFNLEPGALYEIVALRDQIHDCAFNEDRVRVVEIKKVARRLTVRKKSAIEGSIITFQEPECKRLDCENYGLCHPYALDNGKKFSVVGIEGDAKCPIGLDLVLVKLM
ncbi:MAG: UPF0179 family protein [Candidatus Methanoplasma sp.]|jgi:uncharacterized protein (UPF0179 family)|nr:UPF0179 family protein [Candidatus Methanoplasma sp.]